MKQNRMFSMLLLVAMVLGLFQPVLGQSLQRQLSVSEAHSSCAILPGQGSLYQNIFQEAYDRHGAGKLGCAINSVHLWNQYYVQDFEGGEFGQSAIFYDGLMRRAFVLGAGILQQYWTNYRDWGTPIVNGDMVVALESPQGTQGYLTRFPNNLHVYTSHFGTFVLRGVTLNRFDLHRGTAGGLGFPTGSWEHIISPNSVNRWRQPFEGGYIYTYEHLNSGRWIALATYGYVYTEYHARGSHTGGLGFPVGDMLIQDIGIPFPGGIQNLQVQRFQNGQIYYGKKTVNSSEVTETTLGEMFLGYQAPCKPGTNADFTTWHSNGSVLRNAYDWHCMDVNHHREIYSPIHGQVVLTDLVSDGGTIVIRSLQDNSCTMLLHVKDIYVNQGDIVTINTKIGRYYAASETSVTDWKEHVHLTAFPQIYGQCNYSRTNETPIIYNEVGYEPPACVETEPDNNTDTGCGTNIYVTAGISARVSNNTVFSDVPDYHHFYLFIDSLYRQGVIDNLHYATLDNHRYYTPNALLRRDEMAGLIVNAMISIGLESSVDNCIAGYGEQFSDVPQSNRFYRHILCLKRRGVVIGYTNPDDPNNPDNTLYKPDEYISRETMARYIAGSGIHRNSQELARLNRLCSSPNNNLVNFPDVFPDNHFYCDILFLKNMGIVSGHTGGEYRPNELITKETVAAIIANALRYGATRNQFETRSTGSVAMASPIGIAGVGSELLSIYSLRANSSNLLQQAADAEPEGIGFSNFSDFWVAEDSVGLIHYNVTSNIIIPYTVADGLLDENITALAADSHGVIWAGTQNGLNELRHSFWYSYTVSEGLPDNYITALALSSTGDVWAATLGGLSKYNGMVWQVYTTTNGLPEEHFIELAFDGNGLLWGVTFENVLGNYNGETWTTVANFDSDLEINAIVIADDVIYLGTDNGLAVYVDGDLTLILPQIAVSDLGIDFYGRLWVFFRQGGYGIYDRNGWIVYPVDLKDHLFTTVIPMDVTQQKLQNAYHRLLTYTYNNGRLHWANEADTIAPGTMIAPDAALTGNYTYYTLPSRPYLPRSYALIPGGIAILRSSVMIPTSHGEVTAMYELAEYRQFFENYLNYAAPTSILNETQTAAGLNAYELLIIPAFRSDATAQVLAALEDAGALEAIRAFVARGGTLYAQGTGQLIAQAAGVFPAGVVDPTARVQVTPWGNRGYITLLMPESPLAYSLRTDELYLLDAPVLHPEAAPEMEVIAVFANAAAGSTPPAVVRQPYGAGQVIGVAGHPTDSGHREQAPLFMNALFLALSARAEFYGDAIQTWNPAYDPHEFPAYERVPVSVTLKIANLWDTQLYNVVVTETVSAGYTVLTPTLTLTPTRIFTTAASATVLVWELGDLEPHAALTIGYQAQTEPETLAAGVGTFSTGSMAYTDPDSGKRVLLRHPPFRLTAKMAARLEGDRGFEPNRLFGIPAEGFYADVALPLFNKEHTQAPWVQVRDWVYLLAPIVDYENQHVILSANNGETPWMKIEPFLYQTRVNYPLWQGATSPTQTITLADWLALPERPYCVFTSTHGIHTDPPPYPRLTTEDYGSFITIPEELQDYVQVTPEHELLLPCMPLTFDLGAFPPYWYEEPAVRYGVHVTEFFGRAVRFHGTPHEDTLVLPYDAGSVFIAAGENPVPFREHLETGVPYAAQPPGFSGLMWTDVWSRTHTTPFRSVFVDVWNWDSCATCDGSAWAEQHAGANVTYQLVADLDGDGIYETPVREIPTRLAQTQLRFLIKTYSATEGDHSWVIPPGQNLLLFPIFKGLGIRIVPESGDWFTSYAPLTPGTAELISVTYTLPGHDTLWFTQDIPLGSSSTVLITGTVESYPFNREGLFKIHDGLRLIYRQMFAGPNAYEIYDSYPHTPQGHSTDGRIRKTAGPLMVNVFTDTLIYNYSFWDGYDPRVFGDDFDTYQKSWGYGDAVFTTYGCGREGKTLYSTRMGVGDFCIVRVAFDNNQGITVTNFLPQLQLPAGMTATLLYEDPTTMPEPLWPQMAFLNRASVPDAWRSVWYFKIEVGAGVDPALWGQVIEIPIAVSGDNLPADYEAPPLLLGLVQPGAADPRFTLGLGEQLVITDTLPANINLHQVALVTNTATLAAVRAALDWDAAHPYSDTAGALVATLTPTVPFTVAMDGVVAFDLPAALRQLPPEQPVHLIALTQIVGARHGENIVNIGPLLCYTDDFGKRWCEQAPPVTVEGAGAWMGVTYECLGGWVPSTLPNSALVTRADGYCTIPGDGPSEIQVLLYPLNDGDAVARAVTYTLALPDGVTIVEASLPWLRLEPGAVVWELGDFAPGARQTIEIVLQVQPRAARMLAAFSNAARIERVAAIDHSDAQFRDDYSGYLFNGRIGDALWVNVYFERQSLYLPLVLHSYDPRPDLVVTQVMLDPADPTVLAVHIANIGLSAARNFWVDAYFNPVTPPEANQPWQTLNPDYGGAAWFVPELAAGESLILTLEDDLFIAEQSRWPTAYGAGEHHVWAYVDSWGYPWSWGGVNEVNETNNRFGPVTFTGAAAVSAGQLEPLAPLPARPRYPLQGAR